MTPVDPSAAPPRLFQFDSFTIDLTRRVVARNGQRVHLTAKPLETLIVLASRPGETISKQELMETVWRNTAVTEDVLVQAIGEIRRALGERTGEDRFVQTVPRQGYRFVMPVTIATPDRGPVEEQARNGGTRNSRSIWIGLASVALTAIIATAIWFASSRHATMTASTGPGDLVWGPQQAADWVRVEGVSSYGTIHAGGVVVRIDGDRNRNAEASLEWRDNGGAFRTGHPLVRIDADHFAGSVFWLAADTAYELRVTLRDRDGVRGDVSTVTAFRTRRDSWPESSLGTLHVSPGGRDSNTGASAEHALRTIQRAADMARPGDVVLIHPGIYRQSVHVRRSGTWIQPIAFRGAGPDVILDGADERIAAGVKWKPIGEAVHVHTSGFQTTHVSTEQGRLFNYRSLDDLRALRAGAPGGFFADKDRLFLKFFDGSSPSDHVIHAGRLDRGFVLEKLSWVSIEGLQFRHFGGSNDGVAVWLGDCTDCRVYQARIGEVGRAGIWVEGGERGRLEDNEIWDTSINKWPWHDANASSADTHGIFFSGRSPRGYVVRRNRIRGTFNGIAPCGTAPPASGMTTETDVYDNEVSELGNDAIEAEPYCANLRIWGNRLAEVMMGISTAPAGPGPTWILRNIAYRFGAARGREVWLASALKFNTFDQQPPGAVFVYHNTFVTDVANVDAVALLDPSPVTYVRARNNVIAGTRHAVFKVSPMPWDGDANALYTTSTGPLVEWLGTPYATFQTFSRATGQERVGLAVPPQLTDPARGDFTPSGNSALVDRGVLIPGVNERFTGRAPDIGAIEVRR
jgi:DNA-binding winged helix-turn-helix (wHTH) protein